MLRVLCPCCDYLTLEQRYSDEICYLCDWQDDGQDTANEDEVWGGPNGDYSIAEARGNFKLNLSMYRKHDTNSNQNIDVLHIKKEIIEHFNRLRSSKNRDDIDNIWYAIVQLEDKMAQIKHEITNKFSNDVERINAHLNTMKFHELKKRTTENKKKRMEMYPEKRVIYFYETNKPYGCFSNFSIHPIILKDREWKSTEHYFQAQKFAGTQYEEEIRNANTPMKAALLGRDRSKPLREDWEQCKVDIMKQALVAKFEQHPILKSILLSTGNCTLVEHTANDSYWGDGGHGEGENMLGKLLMEIRNEYEEYSPVFYLPRWLAFPDYEPFCMGWRMGAGEDYKSDLHQWEEKLSPEAKKEYEAYFTPPKAWAEAIKIWNSMKQ